MRRLIIAFAFIAPVLLVILWPRAPWVGVGILALSHALLLIPTIAPNMQWLGPVITRFATDANEVWLTIDDGPSDDTPAVLDVLAERGVPATFFVKGTLCRQYPEFIREMLARGHSVANHSDTHPAATFWCTFPGGIAEELDRCAATLAELTSEPARWFRAPVGTKNPFVHPALQRRGLRLIGWTIRGFDTVDGDCDRIAGRIVPKVDAGTIIVMHQGREFSARCIARVVDELQSRGYRFVIPSDDRLKTKR